MEKQELTVIDKQIKKILEGLQAFKDPRDRQLVIENIPDDLRRRFNGNERPVDMASVFTDLFKRYSHHRSALLEAINYIESDSDDFKDLEICVNELSKPRWKRDLIELFKKIGKAEEYKVWYKESLINPSQDEMTWEEIVEGLLDSSGTWQTDDYYNFGFLPPLLKFIWIGTTKAVAGQRSEMEKLAKQLLGIKADIDITKVRDDFIDKSKQDSVSFSASLQFALIPNLKDTYTLVIFYLNRNGKIQLHCLFKKVYSATRVEEIEKEITEWLRQNLSSTWKKIEQEFSLGQETPTYEKTIAFFLPDTLLYLPIDEWDVVKTPFGKPLALGTEYSVVLKSIERYTNELYENFRGKIKERLKGKNRKIYSLPDNLKTGMDIYTHLDTQANEEIRYLAIPFLVNNKNVDLLKGVVAAGIPFVLWVCKQPQKSCPQADLEKLLSNGDELLGKIKSKRKEMRTGQSSINVSVLWEDKDHSKEIEELVKMATNPPSR